jgi:hypothetical protein
MPWLSPLKSNILDLYPGAKSVAEQYPGLYAKYPNLFTKEDELLRPDRHLDLAQAIANNPDVANALKDFGIDIIRHQSAHGVQAKLGGAGIFSEVFAYLNPAKGMKAIPKPLSNFIKTEKNLYGLLNNPELYKSSVIRRYLREPILNPIQRNWSNFMKLFKKKPEEPQIPEWANGGLVIPRFKTGGYVGMMPKFADGGLANLHQGEYVFQKSAVDRIGLKNLNAMNQGDTISGDSVYNYNINVNVKSDANANQIADTVLRQIKQIDSQKLRGVRI